MSELTIEEIVSAVNWKFRELGIVPTNNLVNGCIFSLMHSSIEHGLKGMQILGECEFQWGIYSVFQDSNNEQRNSMFVYEGSYQNPVIDPSETISISENTKMVLSDHLAEFTKDDFGQEEYEAYFAEAFSIFVVKYDMIDRIRKAFDPMEWLIFDATNMKMAIAGDSNKINLRHRPNKSIITHFVPFYLDDYMSKEDYPKIVYGFAALMALLFLGFSGFGVNLVFCVLFGLSAASLMLVQKKGASESEIPNHSIYGFGILLFLGLVNIHWITLYLLVSVGSLFLLLGVFDSDKKLLKK